MKNDLKAVEINNLEPEEDVVITYGLINNHSQKTILILTLFITLIMTFTFGEMFLHHPNFFVRPQVLLTVALFVFVQLALWLFVFRRKKAVINLRAGELEFSGADQSLAMLNRNKRDWSDVHSVQISYPETAGRSNHPFFRGEKYPWMEQLLSNGIGPNISIDFISGGSATITLSLLTRLQAEDLFSALEKYGDNSRFSSDFVKMQKAIILERTDSQSFTQLWSESLSPQYCATTYVPLPTGHLLQEGRYKVLMELGAGGMSAVYLARADGVKVVLKESVLPHDIGEKQQQKARELFEREARMLLKLKHAQIARVLDRFVETERDYLVLEYIPGLTLSQLVKARGKQKEKDVLAWGRQLMEILVYLHGQEPPLLHRDLTPENVIVKEDKSIVLIDFGAANEFVGQATGTMIGKQCYIAPEQLRGKASQASDLYALGATMYFLLTADDPEPLSSSHTRAKNGSVSQATDNLIAKLTAYEFEERPPSAAAALKLFDGATTSDAATSKVQM